MKSGLKFLTAVILFCVLPGLVRLAAQNASSKIIAFDAPGAITVADLPDGTFPSSVNKEGTITGIYIGANTLYHGFVRSPGGEFTTLDAPGAGTSVGTRFRVIPGGAANINSRSISINNRGTITENYVDSNNVSHGFLRSPGGEFITFDAPGASSVPGSFDGTFPDSINDGGTITGHYADVHGVIRGFLRSPEGELSTFDAPGAGSVEGPGYGTFPESINYAGAITGHYTDVHNVIRGFLRSSGGELITLDALGASSVAGSGDGAFPESINDAGAITGHYTDVHNVTHGFLRSPGGEFITLDAPGASSVPASGYGTFPQSMNDGGTITGHYTDAAGVTHGFVRIPSGKFISFDAPGANSATGSFFGTFPISINDTGIITGNYTDDVGRNHGFLRMP